MRATLAAIAGGLTSAAILAPMTLGAAALVITACSKPPAPPPPPPPPPPAPPKKEPVQIDPLRQAMKVDARVQFPQEKAPVDEDLARGVLSLADAIVRGDSAKMQGLLDPTASGALASLTGSGEWDEATGKIEAIRVVRLVDAGGIGMVTLAIQDPQGAYILNWAAAKSGEKLVFTGAPAADGVKPRASDWDKPGVALDAPLATGGLSPTDTDATEDSSRAQDSEKPASEEEAKEDDGSITRNTPAGPVKIPTKPRDDGGGG
jgi:hypothetical protein